MVLKEKSIMVGKPAWPRVWAVIAVILILSSPTLLTEKGSWNVTSRWALARAIVERGTFAIDGLEWATGDRSFREGHYYSDKAPGLPFLGAAVLAPLRLIERLVGNFGFSADFFLVRMATVTLPTWILMAAGFIWLRKRGFPDFEARYNSRFHRPGRVVKTANVSNCLCSECFQSFCTSLVFDFLLPGKSP